jgi:hypothetical protein
MELDPRIKIIVIILIILFIVSGIPIGLIKNHFNQARNKYHRRK